MVYSDLLRTTTTTTTISKQLYISDAHLSLRAQEPIKLHALKSDCDLSAKLFLKTQLALDSMLKY